ncbi:MAG TPA: hypothetical protein VKA48_11785 [Gammaproteobacteria bacterium]|nr:hypothetical protein [Gammaproteobacteria bacterium]
MTQKSCAERVRAQWQSARDDLATILYPQDADPEDLQALGQDPEDATLAYYGLSFDYVPYGTFSDQEGGYFRYQLSWGGPSSEIRFYVSLTERAQMAQGERVSVTPDTIEFWFLDWFDGASHDVTTDAVALAVWDWFEDVCAPTNAMLEAGTDLVELLAEEEE